MNVETLYKISYGIYIISSNKGEMINGQVANTVFQITSDPATMAVSINKKNLTHDYISSSKAFAVSILNIDTPLNFIGQFGFKSGREINKFDGVKYKKGIIAVPVVLDNSVGYLECQVADQIDCATHTVFIGLIKDAVTLDSKIEPMTYAYYHFIKKGISPENAPTYIKKEK
ncbi:MAG: flavin reductase domain-containing FMN-binding protein [Candidatus Saganbacteria bacterium]|uniref:Flavin reductase domain-containing FMN-binding protein n=1 Tax=Candidatus Saganbacteria bacterium TaxID=2575572 RepID=A0A833P0L7_UNCSA|nr:MAG: flavin reductase domain-containing FMN-binding protein [Candidatus Saganbacteria bacterium]